MTHDTGSTVVVGFGIKGGNNLSLAPALLSAVVPDRMSVGSFRIIFVNVLEMLASSLIVILILSKASSFLWASVGILSAVSLPQLLPLNWTLR